MIINERKLFCFNGPFLEMDPQLVKSFTRPVAHGNISKVVDMVESGMPVDIVDEYGYTALMRAAMFNRTDVVCCLLEKGANVDKPLRDGWTALYWASIYNYTDVIKILLQHGARTDNKSNDGITPIDVARS